MSTPFVSSIFNIEIQVGTQQVSRFRKAFFKRQDVLFLLPTNYIPHREYFSSFSRKDHDPSVIGKEVNHSGPGWTLWRNLVAAPLCNKI